jgi:hypothetical protein
MSNILCCFVFPFISLLLAEKIELKFDKFRMVYEPKDESQILRIVEILKSAIPKYEKYYGLQLSSVYYIYLPSNEAEFDKLTPKKIPVWSSALYYPEKRAIILKKPDMNLGDFSIEESLLHELSHLYFQKKFENNLPPLWFNEGLADYYAGKRLSLQDGVRLANAMLAKKIIPLAEIDSLLNFSEIQAQLAYLQSLSAVIFLQKTMNHDSIRWSNFIADIGETNFELALNKHTHWDRIDFEIYWLRWLHKKYQWFVIFNLENLIWLGIAMVLIGALYAIRYRNKKRLIEMELEEFWYEYEFKDNLTKDESNKIK